MQAPEFLPLGTVCSLTGNPKTIMIIARGLVFNDEGNGPRYYDYGGCLYPEGMLGHSGIYFNHEAIDEVVSQGYSDANDAKYVKALVGGVEELDAPKASPEPLNPDDFLPVKGSEPKQGGSDE
jgi:hypothetical protein